MSNLTNTNIHPEVRAFVAMLCEGFNIPSSDTKLLAFAEKIKHPHIPALKETYNIFTDGRGATNKMPTIAEVMEIYKNVEKRYTREEVQKITQENITEIDYEKSKVMFSQLKETVIKGGKPIKNIIDRPVTAWQKGYQFTINRDDNGQDWVHYHNHPRNED